MQTLNRHKEEIIQNGFTVINEIFTGTEVENIIKLIEEANVFNPGISKSTGIFAIRRFFKEIPEALELIFNDRLMTVIQQFFGSGYGVVKSIYFDKPEQSNWFVAYHQDLTISVNKKAAVEGYTKWTVKQDQFAVQPPLHILENNFTIRIHLDNTDENNGALKVIAGSYLKGICRPETIDLVIEKEIFCVVKKGGIMVMKPLLLHASNKTLNQHQRRVIHIEFSNAKLPPEINWAENFTLRSF